MVTRAPITLPALSMRQQIVCLSLSSGSMVCSKVLPQATADRALSGSSGPQVTAVPATVVSLLSV